VDYDGRGGRDEKPSTNSRATTTTGEHSGRAKLGGE
jgi:hypothetical protein